MHASKFGLARTDNILMQQKIQSINLTFLPQYKLCMSVVLANTYI